MKNKELNTEDCFKNIINSDFQGFLKEDAIIKISPTLIKKDGNVYYSIIIYRDNIVIKEYILHKEKDNFLRNEFINNKRKEIFDIVKCIGEFIKKQLDYSKKKLIIECEIHFECQIDKQCLNLIEVI